MQNPLFKGQIICSFNMSCEYVRETYIDSRQAAPIHIKPTLLRTLKLCLFLYFFFVVFIVPFKMAPPSGTNCPSWCIKNECYITESAETRFTEYNPHRRVFINFEEHGQPLRRKYNSKNISGFSDTYPLDQGLSIIPSQLPTNTTGEYRLVGDGSDAIRQHRERARLRAPNIGNGHRISFR